MSRKNQNPISKKELLQITAKDIKEKYGITKKKYVELVNDLIEKDETLLLKNTETKLKKHINSTVKMNTQKLKAAQKALEKKYLADVKELEKMYYQAEKEAIQIKIKQQKAAVKEKKNKDVPIKISNNTFTSRIIYYFNAGNRPITAEELKKHQSHFTDGKGDLYLQLYTQVLNVKSGEIFDYEHKKTFDYEKKRWGKLWHILSTDTNAPKSVNIAGSSSIDAIVVSKVSAPGKEEIAKKFDAKKEEWFMSDVEGGMYHTYINYSLNKEAKNFNEMFKIENCDYVEDNYKNNSCFINILVDTFYAAFQNQNSYKFDATYEDFCDLLDVNLYVDSIGLTINKALVFFKKFKIALCVIGVFGIIEMYKPEKRSHRINPNALYLLVSNGHCYKLNENLNKFNKLIWESDQILSDELKKVDVANMRNTYFIQNTDQFNYEAIYVDSLDDIFSDVNDCNDEEKELMKSYIVRNGNLNNVMLDMINNKPSYIPDVTFENGKIICLKFKIENIIGTITTCSTLDPEQKDLNICDNIYKPYHTARNTLYKELFTQDHLSTYNPANMELEKLYTMRPMTGYFDIKTPCNKLCMGIDTRKAYTGDFMDIEKFPVYGYFDIWKPYDNHTIEDYNQYLVLCTSNKPEHLLLFPETITRVTGYKLNRIDFKEYTILHYKRPSKLVNSNSKELIRKLWDTKISDNKQEDIQSKKDIFNIISGLLEKKYNKKSCSKIFKRYDEAFYYQSVCGGEIYVMNYDGEDFENQPVFSGKGEEKKGYLLEKRGKVELVNGFTPIKEMIYDIRSLKNYQTFMKLKLNGIKPLGIKTDSILVEPRHKEKAKTLFDFSDRIGNFKFEFNKPLCGEVITKFKNKMPMVNEIKIESITLKNERDKVEINSVFDKLSNVLLLGNLPGVGKTTTACNYECKKKLFVCPYNKLCQAMRKKGIYAITLNMLLGIGCNDASNKKMKKYDVTDYDCIVFDEIFLYNIANLKRIKEFMLMYSDKKFIATGDNQQNTPIGMDTLNVPNIPEYLKQCVGQIFSNQLTLQECKRLKKKEDIERMVNLKKDILNTDLNIMDTLKKYKIKVINKMENLKTINNICYFNHRCESVNSYVHKKFVDVKDKKGIKLKELFYFEGLELICKEHYKNSKVRLFVNYTYIIEKISTKFVTLCEPIEDIKFTLPTSILSKFKLPYANTNHSVQGLTIEEDYTIFDANTPYINRQWIWVSLTRTDDLNKITVFEHSRDEVKQLSASKIRQYFTMKVENYKLQDEKAGRKWADAEVNPDDEEEIYEPYVTASWIRDIAVKQKQECALCQCALEVCLDDGCVRSNVTVDRMNNKLAHIKENCRLTCVKCNCSRR